MDNFIGFVNDLEVNNNRLIITMQDINNMLPDLKDLLDIGGVDKYYNKYRCTTVGRLF